MGVSDTRFRAGLDRRAFFVGAGAALGLAAAGGARAGTYLEHKERRVPLRGLWTDEVVDRVYWKDGRYIDPALDAYSHLMRDWRNGAKTPIFYGVLDQLFFLWDALGRDGAVGLISGYRSAATNDMLRDRGEGVARDSLHMLGMAADVRFDRVDAKTVWDRAVSLRFGGAGLYRRSDFVHLDVGPVRRWEG